MSSPEKPVPSYPNPLRGRSGIECIYARLRNDCIELETILEKASQGNSSVSERNLKRLDKSVTVMKVGFKIMKKAIRKINEERKPQLKSVG
jgi:hypothetical protein